MKTKIVYTLISNTNDIYLEQLWLSIYSLKLYNANPYVIVLTEEHTYAYMKCIKGVMALIDEIKIIDVPSDFSNMQKSRFLKTTVRKHIKGKFLFVDTDTIITDNIQEIDDLQEDIYCVPDIHTTFNDFPFREGIIERVKQIFNDDVSNAQYYFNSGVMLVDDNELTHSFYKLWHENWLYSAFTKGVSTDQQSLIKTDKDYNYTIGVLPGIYNCQLLGSVQYLHNAKIMHFFNATWFPDTQYNPFFGKEIYLQLKREKRITAELEKSIRECKSLISSPSMIVAGEFMKFMFVAPLKEFISLYNKRTWAYKIVSHVIRFLNKF